MYFVGAVLQGTHPPSDPICNAHRPGSGSPAISIVIIAGGPPTRPSRVRSADLRPPLTAALCVPRSPLVRPVSRKKANDISFVRCSMRSVRSYGWA